MSFGIPVRNGLGAGLLASTFLSSLRIGGRPALFLNFIGTNSLDNRVTFTRASSATFVGSNGLIQSAAINAPRFDYDPVTLAPRGLLIEEQRANLATYSAAVGGTNWSASSLGAGVLPTVTLNHSVAPDGSTTATRLQLSLGGGTTTGDISLVAQGLTATGARGSFYIKTTDGSTKTIYTRGASFSSFVVDGTWRRYNFDAGTLAGTQFGIGLRGGQTPTNSNTADILVWGAQLEVGAFATSYIPTVASQVTRSPDIATMTGTNFSSWYNQSEGTFLTAFDMAGGSAAVANNRAVLVARAAATSNQMIYNGSGQITGWTVVSGVDQAYLTTGALAADTVTNIAYAYKVNDFAASRGGAAAVTDTSGTLPSPTVLGIGSNSANSLFLSGHIRQITYYNTRLPNATLRALSA
jgi:hypothetical protein